MFYTVCFICCKCFMYRTFITPTYIPEVIQLLLWAPVGNMLVRQNHTSFIFHCSDSAVCLLVLHWLYGNSTVLNPFSFFRHMCGIIIFTSSQMLLLSPYKSLTMEKSIGFSMEYQTGLMKVSIHSSIHVYMYLFICPSTNLSMFTWTCLSNQPSMFTSIHPVFSTSVHLSMHLSIHTSIHPSICPLIMYMCIVSSIHPCFHAFLHPSVHVMFIFSYMHLFICLIITL